MRCFHGVGSFALKGLADMTCRRPSETSAGRRAVPHRPSISPVRMQERHNSPTSPSLRQRPTRKHRLLWGFCSVIRFYLSYSLPICHHALVPNSRVNFIAYWSHANYSKALGCNLQYAQTQGFIEAEQARGLYASDYSNDESAQLAPI